MEHLRHLLPFVARYRRRLLLGFLCAAGSAALTAHIPQILRQAVDQLNTRGAVPADLLRAGGLMLALALADSLFRFGQRLMVGGSAYLVEFDMRGELFRRLLTLDQGFYGRAHTGDLMTRVTNDLSAVRQFLGPGINSLMTASLFIGTAGTLLFATNATLAALVLALLPMITILFVAIGGRMQRIFRGVQDQSRNAVAATCLRGRNCRRTTPARKRTSAASARSRPTPRNRPRSGRSTRPTSATGR